MRKSRLSTPSDGEPRQPLSHKDVSGTLREAKRGCASDSGPGSLQLHDIIMKAVFFGSEDGALGAHEVDKDPFLADSSY